MRRSALHEATSRQMAVGSQPPPRPPNTLRPGLEGISSFKSVVSLAKAEKILEPSPPVPTEAPTVPYAIRAYRLAADGVGLADSAAHAKRFVTTDLPHREYGPTPATARVRVSVPAAIAEQLTRSGRHPAAVKRAVDRLRDESLGITPHLHTANHLHAEYGKLPTRHSRRADLAAHCLRAASASPVEVGTAGSATDQFFFNSAPNLNRASTAVHSTVLGGADYMSNFRRRHDLGLRAALLAHERLKAPHRRDGLRWCRNCGQCSGTTCHLVSQLNHFRKGLDVLEGIRRHRNRFLGRDPADATALPDTLLQPFEA